MTVKRNWKGLLIIILLLMSFLSYFPVSNAQLSPIAIAGYVLLFNGQPVPDGMDVLITNENTGATVTVQTGLGLGLYAGTIAGEDGNIINASASVGAQSGRNSTFADLSQPTNWINLTLGNLPPTACFTYFPLNPFVDELVIFDDCSTDQGGTIVSWRWTFGDGDTYSRKDATHIYTEKGTYRVTLIVTDNDGLVGTERKYIYVGEDMPHIPPPRPPLTRGFTVPEMYSLLRVSDLPDSNTGLTIVFMDSGVLPQTYNNIDLSTIELLHHPSYANGLDTYGHGSFIGYEMAYLVQTKIPNARLISYRVFDGRGKCSPSVFLDSLDEVKALNPDIVSLSGGAHGNPEDQYSKKIEELRNAGIIVVVAVGNNGPTAGTILSPGCSDSVIGVGASHPQWADNTSERWQIILDLSDDEICRWSSRGPANGFIKPDIAAPGESIIGPWLNSGATKSGTSLSCPLIASGSALILANNKLLADIVDIMYFWDGAIIPNVFEDALKEGCFQPDRYFVDGENAWGAGIPVFTEVNSIFFWKLVMLFLFFLIIIIAAIVVTIIYCLWHRGKARTKRANNNI